MTGDDEDAQTAFDDTGAIVSDFDKVSMVLGESTGAVVAAGAAAEKVGVETL